MSSQQFSERITSLCAEQTLVRAACRPEASQAELDTASASMSRTGAPRLTAYAAYRRQGVGGEGDGHAILADGVALLVALHHALCISVVCRHQPPAPQLVHRVCERLHNMA